MSNTHSSRGGRFVGLFWLMVSLGSCSVVQYNITNNQAFGLQQIVDDESDCHKFERTIRLGHHKPVVPDIDISRVSTEQLNDVLLTLTEDLVVFIEHEEAFLKQDIARHQDKCQSNHSR